MNIAIPLVFQIKYFANVHMKSRITVATRVSPWPHGAILQKDPSERNALKRTLNAFASRGDATLVLTIPRRFDCGPPWVCGHLRKKVPPHRALCD
ncbi:hypothetical protein NPIL_489081 [Nephila pilipes]|uniref:Uncharacterized protein n=1 Tax=Nephila pilipes TaxID=299642 RepID=A0A8X6MSL5_NEPPI|nr:hypothetical protein NPIL_489081 [Nephila pilipes]